MRRQSKAVSGFTLLELLVVIFIIGVAISFAAISLSGGTRSYEIKSAAKRLYAVTNLALEEAILTNSQIGLRFDIDMDSDDITSLRYLYQWLVYDTEEQRWLPLSEHEVLSDSKLPEAVRLELEVEGQSLIVGGEKEKKSMFAPVETDEDDDEEDPDKVVLEPDIYFLSSGELVAFNIKLADDRPDSPEFQIRGDMVGKISFIKPGDDDEN